jgi:cytochrome c553
MKTSMLMIAAAALVFGMSGSAMAAGDVEAGKAKSKSCAGCHGANGEGKKKNPPLAGMATADFTKAMQDYSSGARDNKTMARTAKKLSDADVANLAAYYASLK